MSQTPRPFAVEVRDGIRLSLLEWSKAHLSPGIPILLIHGLASNARLWDGAAQHLAHMGHAVIALDLRGHGHSDKPDHGYSMSDIASDVADVLNALHRDQPKWSQPLIIGQSWGGNIVVEVANQFPELIRGAVAVDGGTIELSLAFPDWEECARTLSPPSLEGMQYQKLRSYIRAAHPDWSEEGIDGQMHNMERLPDDTIRPWLTFDRHMKVLRGLWEHSPSQLWDHIDVPILFTPASKSEDPHTASKRDQIRTALSQLQRARVEWFIPADHDLHAQYPQRFAGVVDDAISSGFFS